MMQSQPDFLLQSDDDAIKPLAIFTDGFEFHCYPNNRLSDDFRKRRAIIESGNFLVWSITWEDLVPETKDHIMLCHPMLADYLLQCQRKLSQNHQGIPDALQLTRNGMEQLKAFVAAPSKTGWKLMADFAVFRPLQMLMEKRKVSHKDLQEGMERWRVGTGMKAIADNPNGDWIYNDHATLTADFIAYISTEDALINAKEQTGISGRLGNSEEEVSGSDYKERWRRFLACMNVYQFNNAFNFWTTSEAINGVAPEILFTGKFEMSDAWEKVLNDTIPSLKPIAEILAKSDLPVPSVEFVNEGIDDDAFAEMAWDLPNTKICFLAGDQTDFANLWQNQGWKVILPSDIKAKGVEWMITELKTKIRGDR